MVENWKTCEMNSYLSVAFPLSSDVAESEREGRKNQLRFFWNSNKDTKLIDERCRRGKICLQLHFHLTAGNFHDSTGGG